MRLALAQLNPVVGDLAANALGILEACRQAHAEGASLVLTAELSLWGYPPRDLLLLPARLQQQQRALDRLARELALACPDLGVLVGMAEPSGDAQLPNLHNAIALVQGGQWRVVARKQLLPSYDVFDERRYFRPASAPAVLELAWGERSLRLGLTICEDLWVEEELLGQRLVGPDPVAALGSQAIDLLVNHSASPFGQGKLALRQQLAARAAQRLNCPVVYVNQVGGNDELVFDGASFVVDGSGGVVVRMPCCAEALQVWPLAAEAGATAERASPPGQASPPPGHPLAPPQPLEQLLLALVLGVRDYARKCGFQRALLGLSGGIDSALVAVIATAALGPGQLLALLMPSPWSSAGSIHDAEALARRLGLGTSTVPISALMAGFDTALTPALGRTPEGLTAENLQSRIRGTLLMAMANQQGRLLLSTGNKSELAVGYCTLYGDMNGGLAVIGDLYKTTVFRLCAWLDSPTSQACRQALGLPAQGELIGAAIRLKPPSAELQPDQRDSDSLPDYNLLDPVLKALVERRQSPAQLVREGTDPQLAERVMGLLRRAEFKRRQAAPVLKVSSQAFGSGWRMPIAAV
ncbi:MAG: NAD+ synthase [Prochlorococcaceae cyanobacterium]